MSYNRRWSRWFSLLFFILGLALLVMDFLPNRLLKTLADALVMDGDFGTLTGDNALIFRFLLAGFVLIFFSCAGISYYHRWRQVLGFLDNLWGDFKSRLKELKIQKKDLAWYAAVLGLMTIAVIHRMEYLFSSLHHDEAYTYMAFSHSLRSALTDYHLPNNHVFHSILVFISTRLFGNSPWAVRLPAFAAGILIIPAVYSLAKCHYNRVIGLAAGLLVAISPTLVAYSDNARGYTLTVLFGLLLLILGHRVHSVKDRYVWLLIILVSALGMYTIPSFLFPFGILYAWLFMESMVTTRPGYSSRYDFLKYWLITGLCSALLTVILYLPIMIYSGTDKLFSNQFVSPVPWSGFLETLLQRLRETWVEWTFRVPGWLVVLSLVGFILSLVLHKKISSIRVPLQASALLWILVLLIVQRPNAWSKIWIFLLPQVILWVAAGIWGVVGLVKFKSIPLSGILFILVFGVVSYHTAILVPELSGLWQITGDEETAVLFVKEDMAPGDKLVVAPPDDAPVWYYAERHDITAALSQPEESTSWYVLVNPGEGQTPESVMEERGPETVITLDCMQLQTFGKLVVYQCRESP